MTKQLALMEYRSFSGYDQNKATQFRREMDEQGFKLYDICSSRTSSYVSMAFKRQMPLDANGFTDSTDERESEVNALKAYLHHDLTNEEVPFMAYKDVQYFLHQRGWVNKDLSVTEAGKAALASQEVQA